MELKYVTRTGKKLKVYKTKNASYFIKRPNGKRYLSMKQIKASHKRLKNKVKKSARMKGGATSDEVNAIIGDVFRSDYTDEDGEALIYYQLKFSECLELYPEFKLPEHTESDTPPLDALKEKVVELYTEKHRIQVGANKNKLAQKAFTAILNDIYMKEECKDWWQYHSSAREAFKRITNRNNNTSPNAIRAEVIKREVDVLLNFDENNNSTDPDPEKTKNPDTQIASIYLALAGILNGRPEKEILKAIHDAWCRIALKTLTKDKVISKISQFMKFELLSDEDQTKDQHWIDSVRAILF